ncbi:unnamed protein product [Pedinophyceae sp. YPF-701]|nr:unnamed protein product [Pedinophyceae sp. YPF-701]
MPSDRKKKDAKRKALKKKEKLGTTAGDLSQANDKTEEELEQLAAQVEATVLNPIVTTGVLSSHPDSRDLHIDQVTILFHGHQLLEDARLEFNYGRRYGLIGPNGCGKSTLLKALGGKDLPIPEHIDIHVLDKEIEASSMTALQAVMEVNKEKKALEHEAERLSTMELTPELELRINDIFERLDALDSDTAEARAASLLHGLGFTKEMQAKATSDFSGGWRMRISLARALFVNPTFLILDEPTNHLDLEACVWLEETLAKFNSILLLVSHSQDFLNTVCTNIIVMKQKKLQYFSGNFDQYCITRAEQEENQMKQYKWEQNQISHMKEYIARFGHGSAKLARQAQSKEKTLQKMVDSGLTEAVEKEHVVKLKFEPAGKLPPPVLQFTNVSFGYSPDKMLYEGLELGVDMDSRVALVGPNGAGKSTLLKLMVGDLEPTDGMVKKHNKLNIGKYHQHLAEELPLDKSALEFMMEEFNAPIEAMRPAVGRFGITGRNQTMPMRQLSDGLRCRVAFSWLAHKKPNMLLLDEPTNHLDIETIDSLAQALVEWDGGVVLVSHDFRLISQVAEKIWVCNRGVTEWDGDILSFKAHLKATHEALAARDDLR